MGCATDCQGTQSSGQAKVPALSTITAILSRRGLLHKKPDLAVLDWISSAPDKKVGFIKKLGLSICDEPNISIVFEHLLSRRVLERRRAVVILAAHRGIRPNVICKWLGLSHSTYRRCLRVYAEGGAKALFASRISSLRKFDDEKIKTCCSTRFINRRKTSGSIVLAGKLLILAGF
jgi:hypothetical protein